MNLKSWQLISLWAEQILSIRKPFTLTLPPLLTTMPTKTGRKALSDYACFATVQCLRVYFGKIANLDKREEAMRAWDEVIRTKRFLAKVRAARNAAKVLNPIPFVPCDLATCKTRGLKLKGTNWASHPPSFPPGWDGPKCPTTSCRIEHFTKSWIRCQCRECEPRGLTYPREAGGTNIRTKLAATKNTDESHGPSKVSHFHYECCIAVGRYPPKEPSSKRKRGGRGAAAAGRGGGGKRSRSGVRTSAAQRGRAQQQQQKGGRASASSSSISPSLLALQLGQRATQLSRTLAARAARQSSLQAPQNNLIDLLEQSRQLLRSFSDEVLANQARVPNAATVAAARAEINLDGVPPLPRPLPPPLPLIAPDAATVAVARASIDLDGVLLGMLPTNQFAVNIAQQTPQLIAAARDAINLDGAPLPRSRPLSASTNGGSGGVGGGSSASAIGSTSASASAMYHNRVSSFDAKHFEHKEIALYAPPASFGRVHSMHGGGIARGQSEGAGVANVGAGGAFFPAMQRPGLQSLAVQRQSSVAGMATAVNEADLRRQLRKARGLPISP